MAELDGRTLAMAIQAVAAEIRRLRALPDEKTVPGDALLLVDYETAAEALEAAYAQETARATNLPPHAQLVGQRVIAAPRTSD